MRAKDDTRTLTVGPFRLLKPVGDGAMGQVWKGAHEESDAPVAVKILAAPLSEKSLLGQNFRGELGVIAALNHPAIVQVYDGGTVTPAEAGRSGGELVFNSPWFAMEWASSGTLEMAAGWPQIEGAVRDILGGLAHAHARRVVHLDVKPTNVLQAGLNDVRPGWKLADFGISRLSDDDATGVVQGTPAFMAPEQFRGDQHLLGPWTDLYSLGCTVWLLVCGKKPYPGRNSKQIGLAHLSGARLPYRPRFPIPRHLEMWLAWLMARAPANRPQFAVDALEALDEIGEICAPKASRAAETVSTFSTHGQLNTFEFMAPLGEEDELSEELPIQFGQAPVPADWRSEADHRKPLDWEMGLGVFDLREVPFVGRKSERDILWKALRRVHERGRPQAIVIRGATGCGKTRLVGWLAERAVESGAASAVYAHHSRRGGPTDGVGAAIGRALGLHKIEVDEALEYLRAHPGVTDDLDAHLLLSVAHRDAPQVTATDRHTALIRMLAHLSGSRNLVLVVDDAQWGPEALVLVQRLIRSSKARILVLAIVRDEALAERPDTTDVLEALLDGHGTSLLELPALPSDAHRDLIERLLPLEPSVAERLHKRSLGNPLFAVQLVGDWVKRRLLVRGDDGFAVRAGADLELPDNLHTAWRERMDRLLAHRGPAARTAIELAACLGHHVDLVEWKTTCAVAGVPADLALLEALIEAGLGQKTETGFAFVHGILRESVERTAREAGHGAALHRVCADAFWDDSPRSQQRRANHRKAAGDFHDALEPLLAASLGYELLGDLEASRAAYSQWEETARAIGLGKADELWLAGMLRRAGIENAHGRHGEARELAAHVMKHPSATEETVIGAYYVVGVAALRQGDLAAAAVHLEEARSQAGDAGMLNDAAIAAMALAEALLYKGERAAAEEALEAARTRITKSAPPSQRVQLLQAIAFMDVHHARFDDAVSGYELALAIAEEHHLRIGIGLCRLGLGDARRLSGDPLDASSDYERALRVLGPTGPMRVAQVQLAQAANALALGRMAKAWGLATTVRARFAGHERRRELAFAEGILAAVACHRREQDALDQVRAYFSSMQVYGSGEPDLVWLLTQCGEAAISLDRELGEALLERAVSGWKSLRWAHEVIRLMDLLTFSITPGE